jgi:hypothetical protein
VRLLEVVFLHCDPAPVPFQAESCVSTVSANHAENRGGTVVGVVAQTVDDVKNGVEACVGQCSLRRAMASVRGVVDSASQDLPCSRGHGFHDHSSHSDRY